MTTQPSDAPPGLTLELEEAIRRGYAQRDRADMGSTIAYFETLLTEHPDHPVLVYELAGAYDTAGVEEKARELVASRRPARQLMCRMTMTSEPWSGKMHELYFVGRTTT